MRNVAVKRESMDGVYIYKGRFRIRSLPFSGHAVGRPGSATSVTSTRSAPAVPAPKPLVPIPFTSSPAYSVVLSNDDSPVGTVSLVGTVSSFPLDAPSDGISVLSENSLTRTPPGVKDTEAGGRRRECAEGGDYSHVDRCSGVRWRRCHNGYHSSMGDSPNSEPSAGDESEDHSRLLVGLSPPLPPPPPNKQNHRKIAL